MAGRRLDRGTGRPDQEALAGARSTLADVRWASGAIVGRRSCGTNQRSIEGTGFKSLSEGNTVEFETEQGEKGPHATSVVVSS